MCVHKLHCNVHLRFIAIEVWSFFKTKITVYVPLVSELLFYTVSFEVEYADMNSLSWISIFFIVVYSPDKFDASEDKFCRLFSIRRQSHKVSYP